MGSQGGVEKYIAELRIDPNFYAAFQKELRRLSQFDLVINGLNDKRKAIGWTKAELARQSGVPAAAVRRLFSQQHNNPTLSTLTALADALDARIILISDVDYYGTQHGRPAELSIKN